MANQDDFAKFGRIKVGSYLMYREGILGIAEKLNISIEEAAQKAITDCEIGGGTEHIDFIKAALEDLKNSQKK